MPKKKDKKRPRSVISRTFADIAGDLRGAMGWAPDGEAASPTPVATRLALRFSPAARNMKDTRLEDAAPEALLRAYHSLVLDAAESRSSAKVVRRFISPMTEAMLRVLNGPLAGELTNMDMVSMDIDCTRAIKEKRLTPAVAREVRRVTQVLAKKLEPLGRTVNPSPRPAQKLPRRDRDQRPGPDLIKSGVRVRFRR